MEDTKRNLMGWEDGGMAEIRQLTAEEFDERMALSQFAFQYRLSPEELENRRKAFRPERDYGLFGDDGRLLSALLLLPLEAWIGGRKLAMGGVAAVATWPDVRRQGGVSRLLRHSFEEMRRFGQSLSMLHPFSFPFYRKYGYELTVERKKYTLETKHLPPRRKTAGAVRIVEKDWQLLNPVYEAFASRYEGTLVRDAEWWERKIFAKGGLAAAYFDADGRAQGYMLYEVAGMTMTVHDWAAVTPDAYAALWSFAANHDSMIDQLKMTVPADDPLAFYAPDPRFKQEIEPYYMSRIVDAEAFVAQYPFAAGDKADELTIAIRDAHAPWNEGAYVLRIEGQGGARLERTAAEEADGKAACSCDIAAFTALLVGGRRPRVLAAAGRLEGTEEALAMLERRVPAHTPYVADFF